MAEDPTKNAVKGAIEAIYKPIESIVKTLAGPAAEEVGLTIKDSVQAWRLKRQIRLFEQVKQICKEAGIKPQAVKMPLLFEIMEKGSLEESDELQDIWANMLSNAADPKRASLVTTAFPEILKQICIEEVRFLTRMFETKNDQVLSANRSTDVGVERLRMATAEAWQDILDGIISGQDSPDVFRPVGKIRNNKREEIEAVYFYNLKRLGLIEMEKILDGSPEAPIVGNKTILKAGSCSLTALGYFFIQACTDPILVTRSEDKTN